MVLTEELKCSDLGSIPCLHFFFFFSQQTGQLEHSAVLARYLQEHIYFYNITCVFSTSSAAEFSFEK